MKLAGPGRLHGIDSAGVEPAGGRGRGAHQDRLCGMVVSVCVMIRMAVIVVVSSFYVIVRMVVNSFYIIIMMAVIVIH